ncbi:MAG: hypothetical protein ACTSRW_13975 [Candidatus Helarchaeota archaeon]
MEKKAEKEILALSPYELSSLQQIAIDISNDVRADLCEELFEYITNAGITIPGDVARTLLHLWQTGKLETNAGVMRLVEAGIKMNHEKTFDILKQYNQEEIVKRLIKVLNI